MRIEILNCPEHEFFCIAIDGIRVVGGKCCGRWTVLDGWNLNKKEVEDIVKRLKGGVRMARHPRDPRPLLPPKR